MPRIVACLAGTLTPVPVAGRFCHCGAAGDRIPGVVRRTRIGFEPDNAMGGVFNTPTFFDATTNVAAKIACNKLYPSRVELYIWSNLPYALSNQLF
jgi:hypothetical protein